MTSTVYHGRILNMEIPTAKSLIDAVETADEKRRRQRVEECKKKLVPLIEQNKRNRRFTAYFGIPLEVREELEAKGFKLDDHGLERGVSIADAWYITW